MTGPLRALAAIADRVMTTPVPPMLDRICPGCGNRLDFMCREIAACGDRQIVRCIGCATCSTWASTDALPELVAYVTAKRRPA